MAIRLSEAQGRMFEKRKGISGARIVKNKPGDQPENIVEKQILDFLHLRGFSTKRQMSGLFARLGPDNKVVSRIRVGEKGVPDWLALRAIYPGGRRIDAKTNAVPMLVIEVEVKAPGKRPSAEQRAILRKLNETGYNATWADSLEMFKAWFEKMKFDRWIV